MYGNWTEKPSWAIIQNILCPSVLQYYKVLSRHYGVRKCEEKKKDARKRMQENKETLGDDEKRKATRQCIAFL